MRILGIALLVAGAAFAADPKELSQPQVDEIVQKFAAKESEFAKAREGYTYHQSSRLLELTPEGGQTGGKWEEVVDIVFPDGKRSERVVRAPVQTLTQLTLTPQDLQDLRDVQPFVLTTPELPNYYVRYLGKETLDEIDCYTFAVKPKKLEAGKRYFSGIVWVDDHDLQIVKSYGRGVGQQKKNEDQQFPKFETYREQIDGKYWFPTYTVANDTLQFGNGTNVRIRQTVRYEDYKQFKSSSTITFGDTVEDKPPAPAPAKK